MRQALERQDAKLDEIASRTSWGRTLVTDLAANSISYAAFLLLSRLLK